MSTEDTQTDSRVIDISRFRTSCENCNLNELCLPRGLTHEDLERLDDVARRGRPLHRGDIVFHSGNSFEAFYAVRSGTVKLYTGSADGEEQILGFYLPGEIIGLDGVESGVHSCTAVALETTSLCSFPYKNLSGVCQQVPALAEQMFRIMGRELSRENQLLLTITKKSAEERIATFLFSLSNRFRRLGYSPLEFKLSMSRSEIGNYLGLTIETVSRGLNRFQKQGVIAIQHKHIRILDMQALHRICGGPEHAIRDSCR